MTLTHTVVTYCCELGLGDYVFFTSVFQGSTGFTYVDLPMTDRTSYFILHVGDGMCPIVCKGSHAFSFLSPSAASEIIALAPFYFQDLYNRFEASTQHKCLILLFCPARHPGQLLVGSVRAGLTGLVL